MELIIHLPVPRVPAVADTLEPKSALTNGQQLPEIPAKETVTEKLKPPSRKSPPPKTHDTDIGAPPR